MATKSEPICYLCGEPLIYIPFANHYRLVCDNDACILFRECQGNISRNGERPEEKLEGIPSARVMRPDYPIYRTRVKRNYRFARSLNIPSVVARDLRNKSKKEIKKIAKEMVKA